MKLVARNRLNVLLSCTLGGFEPILLRIRARQDHASVEQRLNPQPRQATRLLNHRATQGAIKNLPNLLPDSCDEKSRDRCDGRDRPLLLLLVHRLDLVLSQGLARFRNDLNHVIDPEKS